MNTTHTPGPWRYMATPASSYTDWGVKIGRDTIGVYVEADARLIAAAPETAAERDRLRTINSELVDILARLVSRMHAMNDDRDPLYRAIVYDADKAITRARGTA